MKRYFMLGVKNQWETGTLSFINIGFHSCGSCDLFVFTLLGFQLDIGFVTKQD